MSDSRRMTGNSRTISIVFIVCHSLARIGLELEIVNSDGCGVRLLKGKDFMVAAA